MKKLHYGLLPGILTALSLMFLIAGCSSNNTPSATPPASTPVSVQEIADPIAENILVSLNGNDYASFSKDFSQTTKNTLNQTAFDQLYNQVQTAVGEYQSKNYVNLS